MNVLIDNGTTSYNYTVVVKGNAHASSLLTISGNVKEEGSAAEKRVVALDRRDFKYLGSARSDASGDYAIKTGAADANSVIVICIDEAGTDGLGGDKEAQVRDRLTSA